MTGFNIKLTGVEPLEQELHRISCVRFDAVKKKQIIQMYQRALQSGGTPVSTELTRPGGPHGELRMSARSDTEEMGYTKDYGPHAEYGHRTTNGGWVPGQRFLKRNVDIQKKIYQEDLRAAIRKG